MEYFSSTLWEDYSFYGVVSANVVYPPGELDGESLITVLYKDEYVYAVVFTKSLGVSDITIKSRLCAWRPIYRIGMCVS